MESESRAQGNSSGCPRLSRLTDIRALWHQVEPTSTRAADNIFIRSGWAPPGAHESLIWAERCGGGRMLMVRSRGRCRGGTGGRSSLFDGGVRLIFEGLVTSRPVFVAARCLGAGAAGRGRLPIVEPRASRDGAGPSWVLVLAPAASRARSLGCGGQTSRVAASQRNAASSRATAIATTPAGLRRSWCRCVQRWCSRRCARQAISITRGS